MVNASLQKNSSVRLSIESLSSDGAGVAHVGGMAVFVPFTAPGDVVDAKIVKVCKTHAFAIVQKVETPGPGRAEPSCPVFGKCGGCALAHLSYDEELVQKHRFVADAMRRIGGLSVRNSAHSALALRAGLPQQSAVSALPAIAMGISAPDFMPRAATAWCPCESCALQPPLFAAILRTVCRLLEQAGASVYDEASRRGLVRHIYLRHAVRTDRVMVCLVCTKARLGFEQAFCAALTAAHPQVRSVILNVNPAATNVILGRQCRTLWGEDTLADTLCGVPVRLSPLSFYQVNTLGAEQLYGEAARMAQLDSGDTPAGFILRRRHHRPFHGGSLPAACRGRDRAGGRGKCQSKRHTHGGGQCALFVCGRRRGSAAASGRGPAPRRGGAGPAPQGV